jgi:hypothetical protein
MNNIEIFSREISTQSPNLTATERVNASLTRPEAMMRTRTSLDDWWIRVS